MKNESRLVDIRTGDRNTVKALGVLLESNRFLWVGTESMDEKVRWQSQVKGKSASLGVGNAKEKWWNRVIEESGELGEFPALWGKESESCFQKKIWTSQTKRPVV